MSRFLLLAPALIACHSTGPGPSMPAPPTNTSIATATPLAPGASMRVAIPCGAALYAGPFAFGADGEVLTIIADHVSRTGAQACAGASWVDAHDVFIGAAEGIGCPEGPGAARSSLAYSYAPASGSSAANPVYLKISADEGSCGRSDVALTRP
ncbi:MAG: hypothetical protein K8W52_26590 [Deltaproteobacteria bacterium]|nr:hypothetical protein [Deltaproteobacteria bacterium]